MSQNLQVGAWSAAPAKPPPAPRGMAETGRKTWRSLVSKYDFAADELILLGEFCRTADLLARLRAELEKAPATIPSKVHGQIANPLLGAIQAAQAEMRRLHASLHFPDPAGAFPGIGPAGPRDRRSHRRVAG